MQNITDAAGIVTYYQYDSGGQRVRKMTDVSVAISRERKYVGGWELYRQIDPSTSTISLERETLHVMDDHTRVAIIDSNAIESLVRYQYTNHLGTATLEVNEDTDMITYEEYYPYGNTAFTTTQNVMTTKRYRYIGKERDDESGFYYIGARYYCPWLARWLATDPINSEWYNLEKGQPNRNHKRDATELAASPYEYAYDNPIRFSDPSGEQPPVEKRHFDFYSTTGTEIYETARSKGFSPFASLVVLAQGATESGYGTSKASGLNNFFGIMGGTSTVKTEHGTLREFNSKSEGINFYFEKLQQKWPGTTDLYEKSSFTSNEFDKSLNSGPFEKHPAYFVKDPKHNYDYGEYILGKVLPNSTARFLIVLTQMSDKLGEQKASLNQQLSTAKLELSKLSPEKNQGEVKVLNEKISNLNRQVQSVNQQQNKLNTIINEVKKVETK